MSDHRDTAYERRWWSHTKGDRAFPKERLWDAIAEIKNQVWDERSSVRVEFTVCPCCDGKGSHVHPGIDEHGLSAEDFDEDPDFRDDYFSGAYDVACYECLGARVIPVCLDPEVQQAIDEDLDSERNYRAEIEAERRMGA